MPHSTNLLPRERGVPYTRQEIIMEQVRRDELRWGTTGPVSVIPPPPPRQPVLKRSLVRANWVGANIMRFAVNMARP